MGVDATAAHSATHSVSIPYAHWPARAAGKKGTIDFDAFLSTGGKGADADGEYGGWHAGTSAVEMFQEDEGAPKPSPAAPTPSEPGELPWMRVG